MIPRAVHYIRSGRYDRRRVILGLIGAIWAVYGWAIYSSPTPGASFGRLAPPLNLVLNSGWSGLLWLLCGIVAVAAATSPKRCPEPAGFNALVIPPLTWVALGTWSWGAHLITDGLLGGPRSWVTAVSWSAVVVLVLVIAGWPNDPGPPRRHREVN